MPRIGLFSALIIGLVLGIGIGYSSSIAFTGNAILKQENMTPMASADIVDTNQTGCADSDPAPAHISDNCKNIYCKQSFSICPDGVNLSCSNSCKDGVCTACKPDCKGHETKSQQISITGTNGSSSSSAGSGSSTTSSTTSPVSNTPSSCTENWSCSDWFDCSDNQQTRSCIDSNSCSTINNKPVELQNCTSPQKQLSISLITNSQVPRGSDATITAKVTENQNTIEAANVEMTMTYASGTQIQNSSTTNSAGEFSWTKKIGGNSKTGTFKVDAKATKPGYLDATTSTTFEVVNATG